MLRSKFLRRGAAFGEVIERAIAQSARYLRGATQSDGRYNYRINMNPEVSVRPKYNILRHAGTLYALSTYYQIYSDARIWPAIVRAGQYLRDQAIAPVPAADNLLAVWSSPEVNGSDKPLQVKLGGVGLGLVALLSIEASQSGFIPLADLQALGRFVVYMQKADGSFYSKYIPDLGGRQDRWQSLFYPGEAALGLVMLYQKDPNPLWLETAAKALEYLALSRENSANIPADHWALLATAALLDVDRAVLPVSRSLLLNHAVQICTQILQEQINRPDRPRYDGGFVADGRTTPTATRLEGLLAALSFLPADSDLRLPIRTAVDRGLAFLLDAQIQAGEFAGAMPRAVVRLEDSPETASFNRRAAEVRIDYIQHAMSAMMAALTLPPAEPMQRAAERH